MIVQLSSSPSRTRQPINYGAMIAAPPPSAEEKERLIQFHIGVVNDLLRSKGAKELSSSEIDNVRSAAQGRNISSSQDIINAVVTKTAALRPEVKETFKQQLQDAGIDEATYRILIGRYGSVHGGIAALIELAARYKKEMASGGVSSANSNGNTGVANSNYSGSSGSPIVIFNTGNGFSEVSIALNANGRVVFDQTFYQKVLESSYHAGNIQVASDVASIVARKEGLVGRDLVDRTREVAHDTENRLHLSLREHAPDVATIGRELTNDIVTTTDHLREARAAEARGDHKESERRRELHDRGVEEIKRKAKQKGERENDPNVAPAAERTIKASIDQANLDADHFDQPNTAINQKSKSAPANSATSSTPSVAASASQRAPDIGGFGKKSLKTSNTVQTSKSDVVSTTIKPEANKVAAVQPAPDIDNFGKKSLKAPDTTQTSSPDSASATPASTDTAVAVQSSPDIDSFGKKALNTAPITVNPSESHTADTAVIKPGADKTSLITTVNDKPKRPSAAPRAMPSPQLA
ncbi:MAG: hypothetical protein EB059_07785 [Alphaproteobacteria bacterium]|nr:hypothetical protein [Alphaproteobacteria bacterium]